MPIKQVARAGKPRRELGPLTGVATPEAADAVAEAIVPLGKTRRMLAKLVAARTDVPRL